MDEREPKPLVWVGSSRRDLRAFPPPVRRTMRKGFGGAGVLELIEDHQGSTYRAVYTVRFATKVYVLHAFQKKSKRGIATPKQEIRLIEDRLKWARRLYTDKAKEA